uniref:Regulator of nonsense transcripts UPF3 isoform X1 n=1 Tax=Rhizophora mucronata TaxID=61149 RepID=A0A2P2L7C3_RHIMU
MKGQSDKTKVVVRHLPPTISQATLMEQIDSTFTGRYNWMSLRPGKNSQKHRSYARAYIDFKSPEDVIEFAEFFNGHLFVNEKGTQFKAIVEYAPSQRVPKLSKKDGREGTIYKDPEYLEFLEIIAKPAENLPSAEIQLERREAERAGAAKEAPIVTPLMDFVRQKRAAKTGSRRILSNSKISRKASASGSPSSSSSKRGSEKKRISKTMYVLRDSAKSAGGKEKSYISVPKRDDKQASEKTLTVASTIGYEALEDESGVPGFTNAGKKKILLLKGKEKEIPQQKTSSTDKPVASSPALKQSQRLEASGRIIRSILLNKDLAQPSAIQSEQQIQTSNLEKDKRPPRPPNVQLILKDANGAPDGNDLYGSLSGKQEKRARNKDRPDRVVWTPLRRSDGSYASDESLSSSTSLSTQMGLDSSQGNSGENSHSSKSGEVKSLGSGRSGHSSLDNGSHKPFGRRGTSHGVRDADVPLVEGKPSKRGGASGYGSHEKQVWVQKSSSGS